MFCQRFFLTALCLLALAAGCSQKTEVPEPALRPVRFETVYAGGGSRVRTFSGVAQSAVQSRLSFKVAGTLSTLDIKVGDRVQARQVIARLTADDFRLQVQDSEAALNRAQAEARNAEANYERVQGLYTNQNASRSELDSARANSESAAAGVRSAQKRLELARQQLSYATLRSPVGGAISAVYVEAGENVNSGQAIATLTAGNELEVTVAVPEVLISRVREGSQVTVTFDALAGETFEATVSEVGVAATEMATTFPVTVSLAQGDSRLRSGMAAEVGFQFESTGNESSTIVQPACVIEDGVGRHVFIVEPGGSPGQGTVRRRDVVVGELTSEGLEILSGLEDGDRLITAGFSRLSDGQTVKLTER